ncbi:MAG: hypothetical protein Q8N83_13345 [Ignavibacteria bacterium]|nr:hypothetical protein [Ignavibacteria bacterium]
MIDFKKIVRLFDKYFFIVAVILTVISSFFMSKLLITDIFIGQSETSYHEKYFVYLENGLKNNLFNEVYAKTGFNYFDRESEGALTNAGYIELLENFAVYLITENLQKDSSFQFNYQKAIDLLAKAKETEPFASLPNEERRLMDNIQIFIHRNDTLNTLQSLTELKQVILARHEEYRKIDIQNSWSLPLAIIGIAFTIIFGIWSTITSIKKYKNSVSA